MRFSGKSTTASAVFSLSYFVAMTLQAAAADGSSGGAFTRADSLDEVIVTAQKRVEKAQDVPMAVTAFNEAALQKMGFSNMTDIAEKVPALDLLPNFRSSSALKIYMRGVGQEAPDQIAKDNGVGVYLDDVYVGHGMGLSSELSDVERVEVLPGPQGTLYGRNTLGGAIKFISAKPTGTFGFKQSLDIGDFGMFRSSTNINLPEVAKVSVKLSLLKSDYDGWVKNTGSAGNFGVRNNLGWRVAARWRPIDDLTVDYAYDQTDNKGTSDYLQHQYPMYFLNKFPVFQNRQDVAWRPANAPMYDNYSGNGHGLTAAWAISPNTELKSVTSYREFTSAFLDDSLEAYNSAVYQGINTSERQFTQEFLLTGKIPDTTLSYHVGVFHYKESGHQDYRSANKYVIPYPPLNLYPGNGAPYAGPTAADLNQMGYYLIANKSDAVYGQITWIPPILDERLTIDVGGRESWDKRSLVQNNYYNLPPAPVYADNAVSYSSFDPSGSIDFKLTPKVHTYFRIAKAYVSGGFDPFNNTRTSSAFKPEHMLSTEVGVKSQWWNDRVLFNVTAFREQYQDIQLRFTAPASPGFAGGSVTLNAGSASIKGVEAQFNIVPVTGLTFTASSAYLNQDATVTNPFTNKTASGALPNVPKWKLESSLEYVFLPTSFGTVSARVGYSFHDRELPSGGAGQVNYTYSKGQYNLYDARVTLSDIPVPSGEFSLAVYGKNLADKQYQLYNGAGAVMFGPPRSYGINALYKY